MVSPRNPVGQFHCPSRYKRLFPSKNRKKILFTSLDSWYWIYELPERFEAEVAAVFLIFYVYFSCIDLLMWNPTNLNFLFYVFSIYYNFFKDWAKISLKEKEKNCCHLTLKSLKEVMYPVWWLRGVHIDGFIVYSRLPKINAILWFKICPTKNAILI